MGTGPTLTATRAVEHSRFTLGGAGYEFPGHIDALELVNEAGDYLAGLNDWRWLKGRSTTLDFKAGRDWVAMPADFKGMTGQDASNGLVANLALISDSDFLSLQTSALNGSIDFYGRLYHAQPNLQANPELRMQIWPTPSADESDSLRISYNAGWRYVVEAKEVLGMPGFCKSLFLEILVAVTRGRIEEDEGTVAVRLQGIAGSDLALMAIKRDASAQRDFGPMAETHTQSKSAGGSYWPYNYTTIQNPS